MPNPKRLIKGCFRQSMTVRGDNDTQATITTIAAMGWWESGCYHYTFKTGLNYLGYLVWNLDWRIAIKWFWNWSLVWLESMFNILRCRITTFSYYYSVRKSRAPLKNYPRHRQVMNNWGFRPLLLGRFGSSQFGELRTYAISQTQGLKSHHSY